jgi:hypothetical protein
MVAGSFDPDAYYVDPDTARHALRRRSQFNVIDMATGWKADLIIRKARPFSVEELARRHPVELLRSARPRISDRQQRQGARCGLPR